MPTDPHVVDIGDLVLLADITALIGSHAVVASWDLLGSAVSWRAFGFQFARAALSQYFA